MSSFHFFGTYERTESEYLYMNPNAIEVLPDIITRARLLEIISYKGYSAPANEKCDFIIRMLTGAIFRATGLFWGSVTATMYYEEIEGGNVFKFPVHCQSVTSVVNDEETVGADRYTVKPYELFVEDGLLVNDVQITGVFGNPAETLPNDIETAISFLIEDFLHGDKYDRMQSEAHSVTLGKLEIYRSEGGSSLSGSREVDKILAPMKFRNYRLLFPNAGGNKLSIL